MSPLQITVLAISILWLLGHAGFTFLAGGFDPGTPTANLFVAVDSFVVAAVLVVFLIKQKS